MADAVVHYDFLARFASWSWSWKRTIRRRSRRRRGRRFDDEQSLWRVGRSTGGEGDDEGEIGSGIGSWE